MASHNLYGWDTVFVGTTTDINNELAKPSSGVPISCDFQNEQGRLDVKFGPWSIVRGGSGPLIHLNIPLKSGIFIPSRKPRKIEVSGCSIVVQLSLIWVEQHSDQGKALQFNMVGGEKHKHQILPPVSHISITNIPGLSPLEAETLGEMLSDFLISIADTISFALARTNVAIRGAADWLTPVDYGYVVEDSNGEQPVLAIMAHTAPPDPGNPRIAEHVVDNSLLHLSPGQSTFAISGELIVQHMLGPAIEKSLKGTASKRNSLNHNSYVIQGPIVLPSTNRSAKTITIQQVLLTCQDNHITLKASGRLAIKKGEWLEFNVINQLEKMNVVENNRIYPSFKNLKTSSSIKRDFWGILTLILKPVGISIAEQKAGYERHLIGSLNQTISFQMSREMFRAAIAVTAFWPNSTKFQIHSADVGSTLVLTGAFE